MRPASMLAMPAVVEQVIEVPRLTLPDGFLQRVVPLEPQMAEQLVDVPTVPFFVEHAIDIPGSCCTWLQRSSRFSQDSVSLHLPSRPLTLQLQVVVFLEVFKIFTQDRVPLNALSSVELVFFAGTCVLRAAALLVVSTRRFVFSVSCVSTNLHTSGSYVFPVFGAVFFFS